MTEITSIRVDYKHVDGIHVFYSESLPGLYVAHKDAELAYNDVPKVIETLMRLNAGVACEVKPEISFAEFVRLTAARKTSRRAAAPKQPRRDVEVDQPMVFATRRYAVYACE